MKVVLPKAQTVNNERTRDDGLMPIFTSKLRIFFETASRAYRKLMMANLLATKVNPRESGPK